MQIISENVKTPIFSWCPDIEAGALEQMKVIANLPFTTWCAVMPDAHLGQNCCIGGVVACENVVVPDFVGVDQGCGVACFRTSLKREDLTEGKTQEIFASVKRSIPFGFSHNNDKTVKELKAKYLDKYEYIINKTEVDKLEHYPLKKKETNAPDGAFFEQLGTLGGG